MAPSLDSAGSTGAARDGGARWAVLTAWAGCAGRQGAAWSTCAEAAPSPSGARCAPSLAAMSDSRRTPSCGRGARSRRFLEVGSGAGAIIALRHSKSGALWEIAVYLLHRLDSLKSLNRALEPVPCHRRRAMETFCSRIFCHSCHRYRALLHGPLIITISGGSSVCIGQDCMPRRADGSRLNETTCGATSPLRAHVLL